MHVRLLMRALGLCASACADACARTYVLAYVQRAGAAVYTCTHALMHSMYPCTHAPMHLGTYVHTHPCTFVCVHALYLCTHASSTMRCKHTCIAMIRAKAFLACSWQSMHACSLALGPRALPYFQKQFVLKTKTRNSTQLPRNVRFSNA